MQSALKLLLTASIGSLALAGCESEPAPEATEPADDTTMVETAEEVRVETRTKEPFGAYLTDAEGRSLYLFMADSTLNSTCYDACAEAWPPLLAPGGSPAAGDSVNAALLTTFERRDGNLQVAYDGWPLYYFARDSAPGETAGQDVEGFGAEWYLISPEGERVEAEGGEQTGGR